MHFSIGNANECGDTAVQIQQRMHLHRSLVLAEFGPREHGKAQVDSGGIQRVQALIQVHINWIGCMEWPRNADQHLSEIGKNPPVMRVVGISQRGARHTAVETHVVELAA